SSIRPHFEITDVEQPNPPSDAPSSATPTLFDATSPSKASSLLSTNAPSSATPTLFDATSPSKTSSLLSNPTPPSTPVPSPTPQHVGQRATPDLTTHVRPLLKEVLDKAVLDKANCLLTRSFTGYKGTLGLMVHKIPGEWRLVMTLVRETYSVQQ